MMTPAETLAAIAELFPPPCREPGIADGNDMCPCRCGEVWPCSITLGRRFYLADSADCPAGPMPTGQ